MSPYSNITVQSTKHYSLIVFTDSDFLRVGKW